MTAGWMGRSEGEYRIHSNYSPTLFPIVADLHCKVCSPLARLMGRFSTSCAAQNDCQDLTLCIVAKITFTVSRFMWSQ